MILILLLAPAHAADFAPITFRMPAGDLTFSASAPLFELSTSLDLYDRSAPKLTDKDFAHVDRTDGPTTTLTFSGSPADWGDIRVTVTYQPDKREVLARIRVETKGGKSIRMVRFPILETPPVRRYDTLLFSTNVGDLIHDPRVMIATRLSGIYTRRYPAEMAMQYMVFFNQARSHYLAAYHDGDEFYNHTVRTASKTLLLSFDWFPFLDAARPPLRRGETGGWESPQCAMSVLPGDWHSSADLYREHMAPKFPPPEIPKWLRETFHGWVQISCKGGEPKPAFPYDTLAKYYRDHVQAVGLNVLHIFSWALGGADIHFPNTTPSPYLGPWQNLPKAMDEIRAMGGHVDLYTNGRNVDIDSDLYRATGPACLAKPEDGLPPPPSTGSKMFPACPYSKIFQDALVDQYRTIITKFHAQGAQIDQTSCTPAEFCFDSSHGHRTPATNWLTGTDTLLKRLRDLYKRLDPDFFVWAEGCNERFSQFYDINQGHGEGQDWSAGESAPEQFHYTFPDFLCTGMCDSIEEMCQTYGQGKPFDIHNRHLDEPDFADLLKKLVAVRKSEPDYFLRGRFMDNVGLTVAGRDVKFWRIDRRGKPGMLVNFWGRGRNLTDSCELRIMIPKGLTKVREAFPAGLKAERDGDWLHLRWTGPLATVVFEP